MVALGLAAGALLAEARVLVPMWRGMTPERFVAWYRDHAALLLGFFGPLEVASTACVLVATALGFTSGSAGAGPMGVAALLAIAVLATFPLYFQRANASFADGSLAADDVGPELARWARWHAVRTVLALVAFGASAVAFARSA